MTKKFTRLQNIYFIITLIMILLQSTLTAQDVVTTRYGYGADTHVSNDDQTAETGPTSNHGTMKYLKLRTHEVRLKIVYLKFDISASPLFDSFENALIGLHVQYAEKMQGDQLEFKVYGMTDEESDTWEEEEISYSTAPGMLEAPLYNYALDLTKVSELTTLTVVKNDTGWLYTAASAEMDEFISNDVNNLLTFFILKETTGDDDEVRITSKEDSTLNHPPKLLATAVIGIDDINISAPTANKLYQNYPNPFSTNTKITYNVANSGQVSLKVFNLAGQMVTSLVDEYKNSGRYEVEWNAKDTENNPLPSGIYYTQLITGSDSQTIRMLLVK